ncbi:uncharacterized protein [Pleurodeles waltl]|uniref:uncharacterized protein n=1 Tax=Pleurodeles waltl TaxID=8319 RepID=UPI0037099246
MALRHLSLGMISDQIIVVLSNDFSASVSSIKSQDVQLPCCIEFSSSSTPTETIWRKEGDAEHLLRVWLSLEIATSIGRQLELTGNHRPYLLLKNLSEANSGVYKCYSGHITGRSFLFNISSQEYLELTFPAGAPVYLPCGFSKSSNWTTHFWQSVNGSFNLDVNFNVTLEVQRGARPLGAVLFKTIDLLIPAVRLEDAGVYNCSWGENSDVIELEVIALSKWGKIFGNSYWIIVAGTGGSLALSAVFWGICLLTIKQIKARRKRQKATSRSFFRITASSTPNPYIDAPATLAGIGKETHNEDGDLYVNVDLGKFEEDPKKLRKKSIESDDSLNVTSEDGGCYENTNEEVKPCPKGSNSDATVLFFILNGEEAMGMPGETLHS